MEPVTDLSEFATWKGAQAPNVGGSTTASQVAAVKVPAVQLELPLTV
jgi:hypothetical protein